MRTEGAHGSPGPVRLQNRGTTVLRPGASAVITGGLWAERRAVNRTVSVPSGWDRLHEAGNFGNLALAAGRTSGPYVNDLPFLDSDVYKWLEAVAWTLADPELDDHIADRLRAELADSEQLLREAQEPDGYLDSHFQVRFPGERFAQLPWGHELYCAGHLMQAAVALHRATGDRGLLEVACRTADLIVASFGTEDGRVDGVCGHPEIESALVELYRETGVTAYLDRARYFIDRRGHGLLGDGQFGRQYWQDHVPVRDALSVEGHAVRQLYLLAGVADTYVESGDESLRAAAERLWHEMVATKTYLTGGIGAHHSDEAFGDPFELPNERSYCETCAAIASIMFSWRMLMITGEAKYADLIERTLYNGFLAGLSLDGERYIYANPLQVREGHLSRGNDADYQRAPWFRCACCPPNVMRTIASLEHYVVLAGDDRLAVHQYLTGRFTAELSAGAATIDISTDYPWDGTVTVRVAAAPDTPWAIAVRVPDWADGATLTVNGNPAASTALDGWWAIRRTWAPGDTLVLQLPMTARYTAADPRLDAARGAVAIERGPLVYCLEAVDHPDHRLDDITVDLDEPPQSAFDDGQLGRIVVVRARGHVRRRPYDSWWPYRPVSAQPTGREAALTLTAVPYFTWGNRQPGAMRIWIPTG